MENRYGNNFDVFDMIEHFMDDFNMFTHREMNGRGESNRQFMFGQIVGMAMMIETVAINTTRCIADYPFDWEPVYDVTWDDGVEEQFRFNIDFIESYLKTGRNIENLVLTFRQGGGRNKMVYFDPTDRHIPRIIQASENI